MRMNTGVAYLTFLVLASNALAESPAAQFENASIPPGVLKGIIKSGERYGAFIAGGRTVYSNDTFTITKHGHPITWKVLDITLNGVRFAKLSTDTTNAPHPPLDLVPNFGAFLMQLEQGSKVYSSASTRLLKDQAMEAAVTSVANWCTSNQTLYVVGTLSDLAMVDDRTAQVQLKNLDYGHFKAVQNPKLFINPTFQINVPFTRTDAERVKAGDTVVLCGQPIFRPKSSLAVENATPLKPPFTCFSIAADGSLIGSLEIVDPVCDIFDPKKETVQ